MRPTLLTPFVALSCAALAAGCSGSSRAGGHEGSLGPGDQVLPSDGSYYDAYPFDVEAGETYIFILESDDFDPYLLLTDGGSNIIAQNDDFDDLNSRLAYTFPTAGRYEILVNSYSAGETGDYVLYVERQDGGTVNLTPSADEEGATSTSGNGTQRDD